MIASVVSLLDPEIVIPSEADASNLEFWARLEQWSRDERPRLGPATLAGLIAMSEHVPTVLGLPAHEYWKILGRLASRALDSPTQKRIVCLTHIRVDYSPTLGHEDNTDRLLADLAETGDFHGVILATDRRSWNAPEQARECEQCDAQSVFTATEPDTEYASVRRAVFVASRWSTPAALELEAAKLFPNVIFSDSAWSRVGSLNGDPRDVARDLVHHIGVLNDHATRIWKAFATTPQKQREFGSAGVTASPEGPRTHRSKKAMKERRFSFSGTIIVCEWHTKLKPNIDRVYFCVEKNQIYVGVIVDHLRL